MTLSRLHFKQNKDYVLDGTQYHDQLWLETQFIDAFTSLISHNFPHILIGPVTTVDTKNADSYSQSLFSKKYTLDKLIEKYVDNIDIKGNNKINLALIPIHINENHYTLLSICNITQSLDDDDDDDDDDWDDNDGIVYKLNNSLGYEKKPTENQKTILYQLSLQLSKKIWGEESKLSRSLTDQEYKPYTFYPKQEDGKSCGYIVLDTILDISLGKYNIEIYFSEDFTDEEITWYNERNERIYNKVHRILQGLKTPITSDMKTES